MSCLHLRWTAWERRKASYKETMIWIRIRSCLGCGKLQTEDVPVE